MKIAVVVDGLQVGGIERVCIDYTKIFIDIGYAVTVFNLIPNLTDMEYEFSHTCKIVHINFPRWLAPERYASMIKKTSWGKYVYPAAYSVMKGIQWLHRPYLRLMNRDMRDDYDYIIAFSGHINDLTFVADSYLKGRKKIAWLHGALYGYDIISPAFIKMYQKIKNLICLSNLCDGEYFKFLKKNQILKRRIYNPIFMKEREIDYEKVGGLRKQYGDFCLMAARLADDKDQITAIDAMEILYNRFRMKKKLLLAGDGKNREILKEYVEKKNMEGQIIFLGNVTDIQNYYSAAEIYVHSSLLEGLPTVLLEAMFYEVPIAATDSIPGVREILGDESCGLISEICDPAALAKNIYRLYTEPDLVIQLKKNGKERIKDFEPDVIKAEIQDYLSEMEKSVIQKGG